MRDAIVEGLVNAQIVPLGYSPVGFDDATRIYARRTAGIVSSATSYFGWTEFDVDAQTRELTVTTYGIEPYTEQQLLADPASITGRVPTVVNQFVVTPVTLCADVNRDDLVTPADFNAWLAAFVAVDPKADQNLDGVVSPADFTAWIGNFNQAAAGPRCPF